MAELSARDRAIVDSLPPLSAEAARQLAALLLARSRKAAS